MSSQLRIWFSSYVFMLGLLLGFLPSSAQVSALTGSPKHPQIIDSYGKLRLSFEANQGQTDPRVKFLSRGSGYSLFLTQDTAVLALHGKKQNAALRMKVVGANAHANVAGAEALPGKSNYFIGNDPKQWRTNVPTYGAVKYSGVYPGIDLVYHGNQRLLEYDFVVAPGVDPRLIDLRFQGASKLSVNREGALVIGMGGDEVIEHAPVVYQEVGGQRQTLAGRYVLRGKSRVGFSVAEYDRSQPLVIDPTLVYSSFLGGSGPYYDDAWGIAIDVGGNAYITGDTDSANFPTTPGVFQGKYGGVGPYDSNIFVTKLNPTGSALIYSTFLGGNGINIGNAIVVDAAGNAYITGRTGLTDSSNFPITPGAFQTIYPGGQYHPFVTKLNATGSALLYSTFLCGSYEDEADAIAVDMSGNAYITGYTYSTDFPTTPGAFQPQEIAPAPGTASSFVSKLSADGTSLVYSSYLGGSGGASGAGITVDALGNAYIIGGAGPNLPTTPGALQTVSTGGGFVLKLNTAGTALMYSTYIADNAPGLAIAVDSSGSAYITGSAMDGFPTTPGAYQRVFGANSCPNFQTGFVAKLNATGSELLYSTYLGGSSCQEGLGIAVDPFGNVYVVGTTMSTDFPVTAGSIQGIYGGGAGDAFVSKLDTDGSRLLYSTFIGGAGDDEGRGIAVDASGAAYVTGRSGSSNFPTTPGAFQTSYGGGQYDAFVSKLNLGDFIGIGPATSASLSGPAGNNSWYLGTVTVTLSATETKGTVSATYYSIDGGPYKGYAAPFPISGDGTHQLMYYSVDTTGNQETPHGQTVEIDSIPPVSHVAALPTTELLPNFTVQWSGTDATSGVRDFTIYVSDNGGPFTSWLVQTTATRSTYTGVVGHTYGFYSIAQDVAGNQEGPKTRAEASTTVLQPPLPVSHVSALPATETVANFVVQWSGTDTGGPGIQSYTIYVSDNGGAFTPWQSPTTATQSWLAGTAGHTYGFFSIAQDLAGNLESLKTKPDTTTTVAAVVPGDVNRDGQVNCLDVGIVKASFGKKTGQPGFDPRADVNHDGVVNVLDLAIVSQKLIPGTTCP